MEKSLWTKCGKNFKMNRLWKLWIIFHSYQQGYQQAFLAIYSQKIKFSTISTDTTTTTTKNIII